MVPPDKIDVTALILAGGTNRRMGEDKALIRLGNARIIERILTELRPIFGEILIVTNDPPKFDEFNAGTVRDHYPYLGPISGIHAGLKASGTQYNFIIAADMPFVSKRLAEFILVFPSNKKIKILSENSRIHPLFGCYDRSVALIAEEMLASASAGKNKTKGPATASLIDRIDTEIIDASDISFFDNSMLMNINTPADLSEAESILSGG